MYDHQQIDKNIIGAVDIGTAANPLATALDYVGTQPQVITAIYAVQTTAQTTAANVLTFKYRPTPGSATGEVTIGTLTIPSGTAAGKIVHKKVTPYQAAPGGQIVVQTDGGGEGNATLGYRYFPNWENLANNTNAIASA